MIRKLFSQRLLPLLGLALAFGSVDAQTFSLNAPAGTSSQFFTMTTTPPAPVNYITFDVENPTACPVNITDIDMYHAADRDFLFQINPPPAPPTAVDNVSTNGADYTLYSTYTALTGSPFPLNRWTKEAVTNDVVATGNGVINIFKNLNIIVPANGSVRLMVHATDTMIIAFNTTPLSVTQNNITLVSGSSGNHMAGNFENSSFTYASLNAGMTSINFWGNVVIKPLPPTINVDLASKPKTACIGDNVTFKAVTAPGNVFTWRDAQGNILAQNTTGLLTLNNVQLTDAGRYYVTAAGCNGRESLPDSATLVVNNPPAPTVSGKFDYCLNEQFEPVTVNGTNPNWYYVPAGGSPMPVVPTISTASPNTLIHYVSQTDQFGCESIERTMVRFRAAPRPAPPIVNTPIYYCEEAVPDELFAVGDSLKWYYVPTGGIPTVIPPIPNTSKNDSSAFYVSQTVDGCESDRSVIDVVVTFKPNGQILTDLDNICELDSVIVGYFGSAFPGSQYNWSFTGPGGITFLSELDQDTIRIKLDSAGTHIIGLRVGSKGCLSDFYTAEIYVGDLPEGVIAAKSDACLGQAELIEAREYTAELDSFMWDFDGGVTQHATTEQGPYGIYWTEPGEKHIKVTFINQGCYNYAYDTIMVHPKPSANILATYDVFSSQARNFVTVDYKEGDEICMSDSLKVSPDIIEPGATYKWTPTRFFDTYSDVPVTYARVDFNSHIYLEVEDVYGCQNKDSLKILTKSCCEMLFPNAFTPNNDGNNDIFRPITVGNREIETFRVVNRYGQTVYESAQGHLGWDGTFKGQPADLGTYFYLISFMCEKEKVDQGGEVILVR